METIGTDAHAPDSHLVALASPSEVGLLVLALGALGSALLSWRRRRSRAM